jgi:hypothetical protein
LKSAVRAPPMCKKPVGEGAKRVTTVIQPLGLSTMETFGAADCDEARLSCWRARCQTKRGYLGVDTLICHINRARRGRGTDTEA